MLCHTNRRSVGGVLSACRQCWWPLSRGASIAVDYVDFIQAFGVQYIAGLGSRPLTAQRRDLGRVVLRSRCSLAALNDRTHKNPGSARDGDTAFLNPGTPIYALNGWSTHCRLAARWGGETRVYLAYLPNTTRATPRPCALER